MIIRPLRETDIDQILRIQADAYAPGLLEAAQTFLRKLHLFPSGCVGCERHGDLLGYAFSHPWSGITPPALDLSSLTLPEHPTCFFIHDVAVARACRSRGIAKELFQHVVDIAHERHLSNIVLVAVQGSERFWRRFGLRPAHRMDYAQGIAATVMFREPAQH